MGTITLKREDQKMVEKSITCAQLSELEDAAIVGGVDGYHRLLEDYTGIKAVRHDV